jgi:hypothetical protein
MTPDPVLLIGGTHDYAGTEADAARWYWPGDAKHPASPWVQRSRALGLTILSRPGLPFAWDTTLHGIGLRRKWVGWKAWGDAALIYAIAMGAPRVQIVAHSHGGQVAAYAARRRLAGVRVTGLVTLGMPARADMATVYHAARAGVAWWEAVTGGTHWPWERLGTLFDGALGGGTLPACHITGIPHGEDLTAVATWDRYDLWRFLR